MGLKPWLWLPPATAHRLSPLFLNFYGRIQSPQTLTWSPLTWRNLEFKNRLGLAGGVDKDATHIQQWWTLGPGFVEIGTVTPQPQPGHSGKIFDRDKSASAVWNRLGFPSKGVDFVAQKLKALYQPHFTPIFANIGKNATTPLEQAQDDYLNCMQRLVGLVDAFVINVSSPNTYIVDIPFLRLLALIRKQITYGVSQFEPIRAWPTVKPQEPMDSFAIGGKNPSQKAL